MTTLSIYVEKWYIVGAVCVDNVPHVIELPNKEDRIWLYFYEDVANDLVAVVLIRVLELKAHLLLVVVLGKSS